MLVSWAGLFVQNFIVLPCREWGCVWSRPVWRWHDSDAWSTHGGRIGTGCGQSTRKRRDYRQTVAWRRLGLRHRLKFMYVWIRSFFKQICLTTRCLMTRVRYYRAHCFKQKPKRAKYTHIRDIVTQKSWRVMTRVPVNSPYSLKSRGGPNIPNLA